MEFRYLKYFVAVAQTRHFTRAAEVLGIAQPPLSQQIKKLEHELGTLLFKRLPRGVELTEAGQMFYVDAVTILNDVDRAKAKVKQLARGEKNEVRMGFATSVAMNTQILSRVREIRDSFSNVNLTAVEQAMPELVEQLKAKQLDIALVRLPCYASESLQRVVLFEEPFVAVIPLGHPLAGKDRLTLAQLKNEYVLLFPRETGPALHDGMKALFDDVGIRVDQRFSAPQLRSMVAMARAGFGVAVVPQSLAEHIDDSAVITPIEEMPFNSQIAVLWEASNLNKHVLKVVKALSHQK